MQSQTWLDACYETLYPERAKRLFRLDGAVGPFARVGRALPSLVLAGAEELAEPIEPEVADAAGARALSEALLAERRPIRFGSLPSDGLFATTFLAMTRGRGIVLAAPAGGSPVLRLDPSWTDPAARLTARRRADLRRAQRKAEAMGAVEIHVHAPDPAAVATMLDRAFAVEAGGWKARERTAVLDNPRQEAFLRRYCAKLAAAGRCRIAFLDIAGRPAAMQIMVAEDNALWLLKIGYDEAFGRASPGMLLLTDVVRRAAVDRLDRIEFLGKDAPWTAFWTTELRAHTRLHYYPGTPTGLASLLRDGTRVVLRRLRRRLLNRG